MKIIFETERLIIRKFEDKDAQDLFEYAKDPEISKYLTFQPYASIDDAVKRIKVIKEKYIAEEYVHSYAIELKEENKVIGTIDIVDYSPKAEGVVEIGYMLSRNYQGKGYMTEALINFFKHIKRNKIAKRIICKHDTKNIKSGNVMKRAGMTFEGIERKAGNKNNTHSRYDLAVYSILDEEIEI